MWILKSTLLINVCNIFPAGDGGHETFDTEAQILDGRFKVYKNDHCDSIAHSTFDSVLGSTHSMTMKVTKYGLQRLSVPEGDNFERVCNDKCLFDWSTMYLGLNRVVGTSLRSGEGMCKVCFTWEPRSFCKQTIEQADSRLEEASPENP